MEASDETKTLPCFVRVVRSTRADSRRRQDDPTARRPRGPVLKRNRLLESVEVRVTRARRSVDHETLEDARDRGTERAVLNKSRDGRLQERFGPEGSKLVTTWRMAANQFLGLFITQVYPQLFFLHANPLDQGQL